MAVTKDYGAGLVRMTADGDTYVPECPMEVLSVTLVQGIRGDQAVLRRENGSGGILWQQGPLAEDNQGVCDSTPGLWIYQDGIHLSLTSGAGAYVVLRIQ